MRGNGINNLAVLYGTEANAKAENGQAEGADAAYDKMIAMINEVIPLWSKEFGPPHQNISVLLQHRGGLMPRRTSPTGPRRTCGKRSLSGSNIFRRSIR
jgi:hypothetical protein